MNVQVKEPIELSESAGTSILEGLMNMGHQVKSVPSVAGAAHNAEILKWEGTVRAGGNTWAAGIG
jgi:hypothetical protein